MTASIKGQLEGLGTFDRRTVEMLKRAEEEIQHLRVQVKWRGRGYSFMACLSDLSGGGWAWRVRGKNGGGGMLASANEEIQHLRVRVKRGVAEGGRERTWVGLVWRGGGCNVFFFAFATNWAAAHDTLGVVPYTGWFTLKTQNVFPGECPGRFFDSDRDILHTSYMCPCADLTLFFFFVGGGVA